MTAPMWGVFLAFTKPRLQPTYTPRLSTVFLLAATGTLVIVQYVTLFTAMLTPHSRMVGCLRSTHTKAFAGWFSGVCRTEEQVWCASHGYDMHADCPTADCRAEEIRISLAISPKPESKGMPPPTRALVYANCADAAPLWELLDRVHPNIAALGRGRGVGGTCAACVPADDKRAAYLPICSAAVAACRGPYYRPRYPGAAVEAIDCEAARTDAALLGASWSWSGDAQC